MHDGVDQCGAEQVDTKEDQNAFWVYLGVVENAWAIHVRNDPGARADNQSKGEDETNRNDGKRIVSRIWEEPASQMWNTQRGE